MAGHLMVTWGRDSAWSLLRSLSTEVYEPVELYVVLQ